MFLGKQVADTAFAYPTAAYRAAGVAIPVSGLKVFFFRSVKRPSSTCMHTLLAAPVYATLCFFFLIYAYIIGMYFFFSFVCRLAAPVYATLFLGGGDAHTLHTYTHAHAHTHHQSLESVGIGVFLERERERERDTHTHTSPAPRIDGHRGVFGFEEDD